MELIDKHDSQGRLEELRSFKILDTLTEKEYDHITQLAAIICDMPIALISLVDGDRQWFKSNYGLPFKETTLDESFCIHAIKTPNKPFVVNDARADERFASNPAVTGGLKVVFYAAAPLVSDNGFGLGTVCVIDTKPRTLNNQQIEALQILSKMTMNLLNIRRAKLGLDIARDDLQHKNDALEQSRHDLQDLLDARAATRLVEIADQNKQLAKANKELEAFAYISSHDLQEPLRKIQTFASILEEREAERLSEKGREYLSKINDSSHRMSILIQDLLAYSRSTKSESGLDETTLKALVAEVMIDLEIELQNKHAVVEVVTDCPFKVISFQFRQLIYNLMTNSLKFSRRDTPPHIKLSCECVQGTNVPHAADSSKKYFKIVFSDNGIGFKPEYKHKIFELFQRLGSAHEELGTGIGLAIVKKIVDNHKGHIIASGAENQGATFEIYIPALD